MQLALVRGRATSTIKHKSLEGAKLLICQPLGVNHQAVGDPVIAIDRLGAGSGDRVMLTSDGLGLRNLLSDNTSPARWWTLGIIDQVTVEGNEKQARVKSNNRRK